MQYRLKKITSDASFREFYRLYKGNKSSIIVFTKRDMFKNLILYSSINKFLRSYGILAPKIISQNFNKGFMEIEDFGEISLFNKIKNSKKKLRFYKQCVDVIIKIQKIYPIKKVLLPKRKYFRFSKYDLKNLQNESDLFFNWYLKGTIKKKIPKKAIIKLKKELRNVYQKIHYKNNFLVHRDFHVSNIMVLGKKLGVIDTQDAIIGNPAYDLVSLIDDVRLSIPLKMKKDIFNYYVKKNFLTKEEIIKFKNDFDILSIQRNLKILGIFYRLFKRDKKPRYLKMMPSAWKLIDLRIKSKIFNKFRSQLDIIVSKAHKKRYLYNEN